MYPICSWAGTPYTGGIEHWQIQLFRLFGGEKFGEWPNDGKYIDIKNI